MRNSSRTSLFTRFLATALPTRELTVTPSRAAFAGPGAATRTKCRRLFRWPARWTRRNSARRRSRAALGKHWSRNTRSARLLARDRHGEALAPLRSAAAQDLPPARRCHSCAKSVRPLPAPVARLIGSLHTGEERREGTTPTVESQLAATSRSVPLRVQSRRRTASAMAERSAAMLRLAAVDPKSSRRR